MGTRICLHLAPGYDRSLAPIPSSRHRDWWDDNRKTSNHAKHCLPLVMANSVGYYILSPGTFKVSWNGDIQEDARITLIEASTHYEVDAHAAFGSFTVQARFIPVTDDPGDFVYIRSMPNERCNKYACMDAMIEAWWSVANFGLVFLVNQPGEFIIPMGKPIAQMMMFHGPAGAAELELADGHPPGHTDWLAKRTRPDYKKDLDYFAGRTASGQKVNRHIANWKDAVKLTE